MPHRRILSLWFPRMGAEHLSRRLGFMDDVPFAIVANQGGMPVLSSLTEAASAAGLRRGQGLRDASAMCPALLTRRRDPRIEAGFLSVLARWAGKFSPWVAEEPPASLIVDLTGCAHLFGGEAALLDQLRLDCTDLGLSVSSGVADTVGAAWALARYAGHGVVPGRSGDSIDQEAPATRSRAVKRRSWDRVAQPGPEPASRIVEPGRARAAIGALPVAALRLDAALVAELTRLGLRRIDDLAGQPRAGLARRFGRHLVQRLDQAMGMEPEPVSPAGPAPRFAVRLTLPDPIGLTDDMLAAIDRLLPPLCAKLRSNGQGARQVRIECHRADHTTGWAEIGLASPSWEPERIRPLLEMKLGGIDAGYGIEVVRILATVTEPLSPRQHRGHAEAAADARARADNARPLDDLIGRLGARVGFETIIRQHPADSNIPEKGHKVLAAAWSEPASDWPLPPVRRPVLLWAPEPVTAPTRPTPPERFRWRGRDFGWVHATGPERIAPEWWLDDPNWRSGVRDYWRVTCDMGERLWLYYAHGGSLSAGWFCQGSFA